MIIDILIACSIDGKIADIKKGSQIFRDSSTSKIMNYRRSIRDRYDAILAGANTIKIDDPLLLNTKSTNWRILIDKYNNINTKSKIFAVQPKQTILVVSDYAKQRYVEQFKKLQVKIVKVKDINNLSQILAALKKIDINTILVEGGVKTVRWFIENNFINDIYLVLFPILIGDIGVNLYDGITKIGFTLKKCQITDNNYLAFCYSLHNKK